MNNFKLPKLTQRVTNINSSDSNNTGLPEQYVNQNSVSQYTIPLEYGQKIKQYRIDNGLTELDIANKLKIQVNIIKDYEEGTGIYNKTIVDKINNCLNITL